MIKAPEVRLNDDGTLDEVVGTGTFHLEQMDTGHWWMRIENEAGSVDVWLWSEGKISADFDRDEGGLIVEGHG